MSNVLYTQPLIQATVNKHPQARPQTSDIYMLFNSSDAQGDAAAADRLIINLFGEFMTLQESQFGSREIKHVEKNELKLWQKELNSRK